MLQTLIDQAKTLPEEVASLVMQIALRRQDLHNTLAAMDEIKARTAGEVASENGEDGRKRYPNEESRKAEIARRLAQDAKYQELDTELTRIRNEVIDLESQLELARYTHRTAITLLNLLASAMQAGRQDIEQAILDNHKREAAKRFTAAAKQLRNGVPKHQDDEEDGLLWEQVTVLEARPTRNGTIRAWCLTEDGDKTAVYAKGKVGERLRDSVKGKVVIGYKVLDAGWYAVKTA
ncbi:MAG TPA: hypothetical protein DCL13_00250 [Peptococcaceae bacterium]|nr:hypothetical protein [Peptococcaceae bacterium]